MKNPCFLASALHALMAAGCVTPPEHATSAIEGNWIDLSYEYSMKRTGD